MISRRQALMSSLFGAGYVGLRALATGLPVSFLMNPRRALADMPDAGSSAAQFVIFMTSGLGDPINASVPGSYIPGVLNTPGGTTSLALGGTTYTASAAWAQLSSAVLARTSFWHIMTNTPIHPKEGDVLKLMDITSSDEMLPSLLAKQLAPVLGTIQTPPICLGALTPSEGLTFEGQALPIIPPLALADTLTNPVKGNPIDPDGILTTPLQKLRDQTLNSLYDLYKTGATPSQQQYIDSLIISQEQVRSINQGLLGNLASITDNSANSQILAAVTLILMGISPVISIHIPFGGDNHFDAGLATEESNTFGNQAGVTPSGVASIAYLMQQLAAASPSLTDRVSFVSLNVFGRTLSSSTSANGRQHNMNHQVSIAIGKPFKGAVIGGLVGGIDGDFGCMSINPTSGAGTTSTSGSVISPVNTLGSFGQTMLAAVGASASSISSSISGGQVVPGALAPM